MSDVPSNLIPTRISQLPTAPVADENSLMMIVYQGNNYQIRVGDLLSVAGVPTSTQVIAGTGMTGGGALTGNVTLSVAPGGIGTTQLAASGVTAGVYGDATTIPVFTVDDTGRVMAASSVAVAVSGYVPESRQVIAGTGLTGGGALNANVTLAANLSNATPQSGFQTGSAGVSTGISRADHKHPAVDLGVDDEVDGILGLDNGGTAKSLVPDAGAIVWCGADGLYVGPVGSSGQVLVSNGTGEYTWGSALLVVDQPANVVYAGPASGPDAPTAFRALVNADIPTTLDGKTLTNVDINSGTVDGTTIGGSVAAAVTGTTVTASTQFSGAGTGLTGTASGLSIGGNAATASTATNVAGGAANKVVYNTGSGTTSFIDAPTVSSTFLSWTGSAFSWASAGAGTVSSVGLALPAEFTISNSPVTGSGTLTGTWANETANYVFAGPTTGVPGTPSFRAMVAADVPTLNQNTTGSAASLSVSGQTGLFTITGLTSTNRVKTVRNADDTLLELGGSYTPSGTWNWTTATVTWPTFNQNTTGSAGSVANAATFTTTGGAAAGATFNGSTAVTIDYSTVGAPKTDGTGASGTWGISISGTAANATNLAGGAASQIPYQNGIGSTAFIANGTAGQVLLSAGTGAPTWSGISGGTF